MFIERNKLGRQAPPCIPFVDVYKEPDMREKSAELLTDLNKYIDDLFRARQVCTGVGRPSLRIQVFSSSIQTRFNDLG